MTKPGTTRVKVVVSRAPVALRFRKFRTDSGALSGKNSSSISPASVSRVTHFDASVFISALSNGSAAGNWDSAGLGLVFFTSAGVADGVGVADCGKLVSRVDRNMNSKNRTALGGLMRLFSVIQFGV